MERSKSLASTELLSQEAAVEYVSSMCQPTNSAVTHQHQPPAIVIEGTSTTLLETDKSPIALTHVERPSTSLMETESSPIVVPETDRQPMAMVETKRPPPTPVRKAVQPTQMLSRRQLLYRCRMWKARYKRASAQIVRLKKDLKSCRSDLQQKSGCPQGLLQQFIEEQKEAASKKLRGHKWSSSTKSFALGVYFKSPSSYATVRRLLMLPSRSTLLRPLRCILSTAGICPVIMEALEQKLAHSNDMAR